MFHCLIPSCSKLQPNRNLDSSFKPEDLIGDIERQSYEEVASKHGLSLSDFCMLYTKLLLPSFNRAIEDIQSVPGVSDELVQKFQAFRDSLKSDPLSVIEIMHSVVELNYHLAIDNLLQWLPKATDAYEMIDSDRLTYLTKLSFSSPTIEKMDLVESTVRRLSIVAPHLGGFNAIAFSHHFLPIIGMFPGVMDCLHTTSLIVTAQIVEAHFEKGTLYTRFHMPDQSLLKESIRQLKVTIEFAIGESLMSPNGEPNLTPPQRAFAGILEVGATSFVWYHELAHILLRQSDTRHENEFASDEFATQLLIASGDKRIIWGLLIGHLLVAAVMLKSKFVNNTLTHPSPLERLRKIGTILEKRGLRDLVNSPLLEIPSLLLDEELSKLNLPSL